MNKQTFFAISVPAFLFVGGYALLASGPLKEKETPPETYEVVAQAENEAVGAATPDTKPEPKNVTEGKDTLPRDLCVNHGSTISMHIHPIVLITINGEAQIIPADIGIDASCMKAVHTHDTSGKLHIEYPRQESFTLGDFFANWGEVFKENQILDKKTNIQHELKMLVNGKESTEFENLLLQDNQRIEIIYQRRGN